jgi:hypothetical protein
MWPFQKKLFLNNKKIKNGKLNFPSIKKFSGLFLEFAPDIIQAVKSRQYQNQDDAEGDI